MVFALAGNQNCGKTTLFNQLTGSNQHVGNFPGVVQAQRKLIAAQAQLDGVAHWGYLLHGHLRFRREAHVQQAAAQRALSAHGSNAPRLPDGQFVQRHIRFPHCSKCKMLA